MSVTLHGSTLAGAHTFTLIETASTLGCSTVCAYINAPQDGRTMPGAPPKAFPVIRQDEVGEVKSRLAAHGVSIVNLEFFPIWPDTEIELLRPALARGGELCAQRVVTHVHDADVARATDSLGRFAEAAAAEGLAVAVEFIGMAQGCRTLEDGVRLVTGVNRGNCGLAIDALHFFRTSGDLKRLTALPPEMIAYGQLCDAKGLHQALDYFPDARNRLIPGEGDFPLLDLVKALPGTPFDVEVPRARLAEEGISQMEHARRSVASANRILNTARAPDQGPQ